MLASIVIGELAEQFSVARAVPGPKAQLAEADRVRVAFARAYPEATDRPRGLQLLDAALAEMRPPAGGLPCDQG